jgi:hypothetical protein
MKKILCLIAVMSLLAAPALADTWCQWDGSTGINCQSDSRGYIRIDGFKVSTVSIANSKGWYVLDTTDPTLGENQVRDAEVWGFADNVITKTWTVRDLTATEIDNRIASPLSVNDYWQWKGIQAAGGWTNQQMLDRLPADLVEAFQARARLLAQ